MSTIIPVGAMHYSRENSGTGIHYAADVTQTSDAASRWDTGDTFQKSEEALPPLENKINQLAFSRAGEKQQIVSFDGRTLGKSLILEVGTKKKEGRLLFGGEPDPWVTAARREAISYSQEDVSDLKQRFSALTKQQLEITSKLQEIAESAGVKLGSKDQLKVEVGSDGNVIVGGIEDVKKARKLEQAVNKDKDFVNEIKAFQKEEAGISAELQTITGKSLDHFKTRISELQQLDDTDWVPYDNYYAPYNHPGDIDRVIYSREQSIALKDQDLYVVDEEFASMISDYFRKQSMRAGALGADITGGNDILENAEGTVESVFKGVIKDINDIIKRINDEIYKSYDDHEEIERQLLSLAKVTIRLDSDGAVDVEGTFSISGDHDEGMKQTVKDLFAKELRDNPETGRRNDFFIAAQYLECKYDLAFDGRDKDRKVELVCKGGKTESRMSSPREEERLSGEIAVEAKAALDDMGVEADSLEIVVDEKGKIAVTNMPQDKYEYDVLEAALETLNAMVQDRTNEDYNQLDEKVGTPIERLKGLLAKMDVFLPGGLGVLSDAKIPEAIG